MHSVYLSLACLLAPPLALLAKGAVNDILLREMFETLLANRLYDLVPVGQTIAAWLLRGASLERLKKEYYKMLDLFEDSPFYEWVAETVSEKNRLLLEEANQRVLEERQRVLTQFRETVVAVVRQRFPKLVRTSQKLVKRSQETERLQRLLIDLSIAQTVAEAEHYLLHFDDEETN